MPATNHEIIEGILTLPNRNSNNLANASPKNIT
jgi:hypothetical protein